MGRFTLVLLVWACLEVQDTFAAERLDPRVLLQQTLHSRQRSTEPVESFLFKRHGRRLPREDLDEMFNLGSKTELEQVKVTITSQGTKLFKLQQTYQGQAVEEGIVTVEMDSDEQNVLDMTGTLFRNLDDDLQDTPALNADEALNLCKQENGDENLNAHITHNTATPEILVDKDDNAYPGYFTQYMVSPEQHKPRKPTCLVNARQSTVQVTWNALDACTDCEATGTGGNEKIGKVRYGELQKCLNIQRRNGMCYLQNDYVRVVNNNNSWDLTWYDEFDEYIAAYDCEEIEDEVNGAYSPLLDALFYGTVMGRMFEDWYGTTPLGPGELINIRVHVGYNYVNAFWTGIECAFGDGDGQYFHPLVSLDVTAHEVAHGTTQRNSGLYYYHQWGGINEAFSDITGETVEAYLEDADWLIGYDFTVGTYPPLRYMENPEDDGRSISHADNFTKWMDVHYSSGVYNRAFWLVVNEYEVPIKDAYHAFLYANMLYWHHMSDFDHAACDVLKAAYDLGQDGAPYRLAFAQVGVKTCNVEDHVVGLREGKVYGNITVSSSSSPTFMFTAIDWETYEFAVTVNATSSKGDVKITLSDKVWGTEDADDVVIYAEGMNSVYYVYGTPNASMEFTITLSTDEDITMDDVSLVATHEWVGWTDYEESEEEESEEEESEEEESEEEESEEEESEEEEEEEEEGEEGEGGEETPDKSTSLAGHVFNFFKSFVLIFFAPSDTA